MPFDARIQNKRDTAANWEANNPVILDGELIIVYTQEGKTKTKIGNGVDHYIELPFQDTDSIKEVNNGLEQKFWRGTQEEYDAIETKSEDTMYIVTDGEDSEGGGASITVDEEVIEGSKNAVSGGAVYNAITAVSADIDERIPEVTADDDGKFLRVVDGAPAWATVQNIEEVEM